MPKVQPKHTADSLLDTKNIFTPQYHVSQYSISGTIGVQPTGQAQDIVSPINEPMGVLVYNDQHITDDSSLSVTLLYLLVSSNLFSFNFSCFSYPFHLLFLFIFLLLFLSSNWTLPILLSMYYSIHWCKHFRPRTNGASVNEEFGL